MFIFFKKTKTVFFLFGFALILIFSCNKESTPPEDCTSIPPTPIDTCAFLFLKMDGAHCGFDSASSTIFFSIEEYEMNFSPLIEIGNEPNEISINNNSISNFAVNDLGLVKVNEPIPVELVFCDTVVKEYQLIFTRFPILQIGTNQSIIDEPKVSAEFKLNDPDFLDHGMQQREFSSIIGIEHRGGSAQTYDKKSYGIELWEANSGANSVEHSLLDMRNDDDWILDAMFIDPARMRNRVSTDLWLDFNELHYQNLEPNAKNGTHGKFVEVFLNQEYLGVYIFSERIDRKLLKLKSFDSGNDFGFLYKASQWGDGVVLFNAYFDFNPTSSTWQGWEQKYPDPVDEGIYWEPLANFAQFVVESNDTDFKNQIGNMLQIDNAIDYFILLNLLRADDNTGKNIYYSKQNESDKIIIIPWDMDATWGRFWNGGTTSPNAELSNGLFDRLIETNAADFKTQLKARWASARNNILTKDNLYGRFEDYANAMVASGVFEREKTKWDLQESLTDELNHINSWMDARLMVLDDYFDNL